MSRWHPVHIRTKHLLGKPNARLLATFTQGGRFRGLHVQVGRTWHGFALLRS